MLSAFIKFIATTISSIVLIGCGSFVPIHTPQSIGLDTMTAANRIKIISNEEAKNRQAIGQVVGYACRNKTTEPNVRVDAAILQVKIEAHLRNATVISQPNCEEGSVSLIKNCWQSFTCTATAFR